MRTVPEQVEDVRDVLARSVDPESPNEVDVSRPSDALEARAATDVALRNLLLALGAVALVVGGVGITNVMVISVLERRGEIGVRRALGARRVHIATQFLAEAGVLAAARRGRPGWPSARRSPPIYARSQGWLVDVPAVGARRRRRHRPRRRAARRRLAGDPGRPPRPRRGPPPDLNRLARATAAVRVETLSFA